MTNEPITGEWQTDQFGRRFRMVGNCKEYEPEINGLPRSVFFASQKAQKEQDAINRKRENEAMAAQPQGICPFKESKNALHANCTRNCAFFQDTSCVFASINIKPTKDTKDMLCPIGRKCHDRCVMYNHGCMLTCIVKGIQPGKE